jgi:hypothetical protein
MHRSLIALGALIALAPALLLAQDKKERKDPEPVPGWNPELQAGFAEAKKTGKPMMIVFR